MAEHHDCYSCKVRQIEAGSLAGHEHCCMSVVCYVDWQPVVRMEHLHGVPLGGPLTLRSDGIMADI